MQNFKQLAMIIGLVINFSTQVFASETNSQNEGAQLTAEEQISFVDKVGRLVSISTLNAPPGFMKK